MASRPDWLVSEPTTDLDYAGFAQEFLRRNPEYRRRYRLATDLTGQGELNPAAAALTQHWGLCFPV